MVAPAKSRRNRLLWLLAGAALVALVWPFDNRVDTALDVTHKPYWHAVAWWCSKIGEGWVVGAAGIILAGIFFFASRPRLAGNIFFIALTSELTGLAALILRVLSGRTRPSNHDVPPGFYGVWHDGHWIIGKYQFSSFPSGHAATAVGLAAAAWLIHRGGGGVCAAGDVVAPRAAMPSSLRRGRLGGAGDSAGADAEKNSRAVSRISIRKSPPRVEKEIICA